MVWLDPDDHRPFTWLRGKPGSGKTTLATYLIEEASIPPDSHMLYCLCSYGFGQSEKNACSLTFRSLIAQLLRKQPALLPYIYEHYVRARTIPSLVKVKELLKALLKTSERIYLILDGLDELQGDDQKQVLTELGSLAIPERYERSINIKVLICSRESKEISRKLARSPHVSLSEEEACVQKDISTYTRHNLEELRGRFCNNVVDALEQEIVEKARGMFLWVRLVLSTLLEEESLNGLRATIKHLPSGLPGVNQANDPQQQRIEQILIWLSFSYRSLKASEICSAIVFHTDDVLNAESKLSTRVLDLCKPLIEERENNTIALIHHSAREFLLHRSSGPYLSPLAAHSQIAISCVRYLNTCREFLTGIASPTSYGHIIKGFHDLYPYVQEFWPAHMFDASNGRQHEHIDSELLKQLSRLEMTFWRRSTDSRSRIMPIPQTSKNPDLVDKYLKFRKATSGQPSGNKEDRKRDIEQDPTLLSDAHASFQTAFESLISNSIPFSWDEMRVVSADFDEFRHSNQKSSYCCRWTGCVWTSQGFATPKDREEHEIIHQKRFVCIDLSCDFAHIGFRTAGAQRTHVRRYHSTETDTAIPDFPLLHSRRSKMAQKLNQTSLSEQPGSENPSTSAPMIIGGKNLSSGDYMKANVSSPGSNEDRPPPYIGPDSPSIASDSWPSIISDEGVENSTAPQNTAAAPRPDDRTVLVIACLNNDPNEFKTRFCSDPERFNELDFFGDAPLHVAALYGSLEIVGFLLESKCNANLPRTDGDTPLIIALKNGHIEVVRLLLEHGANPHLGDAAGRTPYDLVPLSNPNFHVIRKLIYNAHMNALESGSGDSVPPDKPRAVAEGIDSDPDNEKREAPEMLHRCAASGDIERVRHFLRISRKVKPGAIIAAVEGGHEEVVQLLLTSGELDPDRDALGGMSQGYDSVMDIAIGRGLPGVVELLVSRKGFSPKRKIGPRPFHVIAAERMGWGWQREFGILKRAYDEHQRKVPVMKLSFVISEEEDVEAVPKRRRLVDGKESSAPRRAFDDDLSASDRAYHEEFKSRMDEQD